MAANATLSVHWFRGDEERQKEETHDRELLDSRMLRRSQFATDAELTRPIAPRTLSQ